MNTVTAATTYVFGFAVVVGIGGGLRRERGGGAKVLGLPLVMPRINREREGVAAGHAERVGEPGGGVQDRGGRERREDVGGVLQRAGKGNQVERAEAGERRGRAGVEAD